jgi:hypothetical protein
MTRRYIRHYYENGQGFSDGQDENGMPAAGYTATNNPLAYETTNRLEIGASIITEEMGPADAVWQLGGTDTTAAGDQVVWGHFYASPDDVSWGSAANPDLFVKIWFDNSGRIDVNFFHVSVPDIEVYSDYPAAGTYDQSGTTIMADRYIRQEYTLQVDPNDVDDDGDGYSENQGDCNDNDPDIHPGGSETCGDGVDQDCDGVDLSCSCNEDLFPLVISDLSFPSTVEADSSATGSVAYSGDYARINNPTMGLRLSTNASTITSYVLFPAPYTTGDCRIHFEVRIPDDISGEGVLRFKLVDYVQTEDNWNSTGVSNELQQAVTIRR